MRGGVWTRRSLLAAGAIVPALGRASEVRAEPSRVAALDWGLASTAAAIGAGPAACGECDAYRRWVGEPALPPDVVELGLRTAPSLETLAALRPDLILINSLNESLRPLLERIAPVHANNLFGQDHAPVARAIGAARELGERLDRLSQAAAFVNDTEARLARARLRLLGHSGRPIVPIGLIDARHARFYGAGSLFADVMGRIGLVSGWSAPTNAWGFSLAGIDALAACRDMDLLLIEPIPTDARRSMDQPGLWRSLVEVGRGRVIVAPPIWAFGDLSAAGRCADILTDLLAGQPR